VQIERIQLDVITPVRTMLFLLWMLVGAPLEAEEQLQSDPHDELELLTQQLEIERGRENGFDSRFKKLTMEIAGLSERITTISADIQSREKAIDAVEIELGRLETSHEAARQALNEHKYHFSASIGGLARLRKNPPEALALTPTQKSQLQLRVAVLSLFLSALSADVTKMAHALTEAEAVRDKHRRRQFELAKAKGDLEVGRAKLERVLRRKSSLQAVLHSDRKSAAEEVALLASKAEDLEELVAALKSATVGRFEPMTPPASQKTNSEANDLQNDSQIALILPGESSLPYPTWGPIIRDFGEQLENGAHSQGIFVQARGGAYVIAPREGQIVFSGHFRTYGRLLIIEHDGGYHSLLAGFSRIYSGIGDWVRTGDPVGVMGDEERRGAVLYIEVRLEGEPVSPRDWLELIDRKVNG